MLNDILAYSTIDNEPLTENELTEHFECLLDESHDWSAIAGMIFQPSKILKECDPVGYRCTFNDWLDGEIKDGTYSEEPLEG